MYNWAFGVNELAGFLLKILKLEFFSPCPEEERPRLPEDWWPYDSGYDPEKDETIQNHIRACLEKQYWPLGRLRDVWLDDGGESIVVLTRNGGSNRLGEFWVFDVIRHHPYYVSDWDDEWDNTYAYIKFRVPEEYLALCKELYPGPEPSLKEKFDMLVEFLENSDWGMASNEQSVENSKQGAEEHGGKT